MKKIIPIALIVILASCAKNISTNGGQWTLNSLTYKATQAYWVQAGLVATTGTGVPTGSLTIWFRDIYSLDTASGTSWPPKFPSYILSTSFPPAPGYAFIQLTDSSQYNSYNITGSTTPTITVISSVKSAGDTLVTVTIPPVMVVNTNGTPPSLNGQRYIGKPTGTDSSLVSGTIIQTQ